MEATNNSYSNKPIRLRIVFFVLLLLKNHTTYLVGRHCLAQNNERMIITNTCN
jgi:hypothetical protein